MSNAFLNLTQHQRQVQRLAPQLRQSLTLLQCGITDLLCAIREEVASNPVLEMSLPNHTSLDSTDTDAPHEQTEDLSALIQRDDDWTDFYSHFKQQVGDGADEDLIIAQRAPILTLQEELFRQLDLLSLKPIDQTIAGLIIDDIDQRGYYVGELKSIYEIVKTTEAYVTKILKMVQQFSPIGVGARSLTECLVIQLGEHESPLAQQAIELLTNYADEILKHDYTRIQAKLGLSAVELRRILTLIRGLSPSPGEVFAVHAPMYIHSEISMSFEGENLVVRSDDTLLPTLHLSKQYRAMLTAPTTTEETKAYIVSRFKAGECFINSIHQRQETITKIAQLIVDHQRDFFIHGPLAIKPLTMRQIAELSGYHETTISRTVSGKYIQTPRGVFELRYFFSATLKADDSNEPHAPSSQTHSSKAVQALIKKLIHAEDAQHPISDQDLSTHLKHLGITCARRTVAKYREQLKIQSASKRRIR